MAKAAFDMILDASAKPSLADGDLEGASNRAYNTAFYADHAALLRSGAHINRKTTGADRGSRGTSGQAETLRVQLGKSLNRMERIRLVADYSGDRDRR